MSENTKSNSSKIKDLTLAAFGRKEITLAETEMPGLMLLRKEYSRLQPLKNVRITGSLHMTIQTAVLIETLKALGAEIRWCSCNIYSTQDHAAAAIARDGAATVFAWKGETLREYWWCSLQALMWEGSVGPDLLVDDGGDITLLLHEGVRYEKVFEETGSFPALTGDETEEALELINIIKETILREDGNKFRKMINNVKGVSEETTTGVHRLLYMAETNSLLFPAINVNDSVTKSKFDNIYGCRHSLPDALMRATDVMLGGKKIVICGYGDVGKGCASAMRGQGARVFISEIDPICALQAAMEGYSVCCLEDVIADGDIFITATGNKHVITAEHILQMKNNAIVGNIGHFDNEIDIQGLKQKYKEKIIKIMNIKPQVDKYIFNENGDGVIILAEGRLMNLGCATGHPSFVMSCSFSNQVLAQLALWNNYIKYNNNNNNNINNNNNNNNNINNNNNNNIRKEEGRYQNKVYRLSKELDEKVAQMHLPALGAKINLLTKEQADYLHINQTGPFKAEDYRY